MQGKTRERWIELCELAAVEQDHDRLMQLVAEIDRLLAEKEQRLRMPSSRPADRDGSK